MMINHQILVASLFQDLNPLPAAWKTSLEPFKTRVCPLRVNKINPSPLKPNRHKNKNDHIDNNNNNKKNANNNNKSKKNKKKYNN
jgi:hypothetical protein